MKYRPHDASSRYFGLSEVELRIFNPYLLKLVSFQLIQIEKVIKSKIILTH